MGQREGLTAANIIVQSSHPTFFTIHIRTIIRSVTRMMARTVTSNVVARSPPDLF